MWIRDMFLKDKNIFDSFFKFSFHSVFNTFQKWNFKRGYFWEKNSKTRVQKRKQIYKNYLRWAEFM